MENRQEIVREKEYYRDKIVDIINKIENQSILNYIYIIALDISKEDKTQNDEK